MPTQTIPGALLNLYQVGVWKFPAWQELTGVILNFENPQLATLPKTWTHVDYLNVKSFYNQYEAKTNEDEQISFASALRGAVLPGRQKWRSWVFLMMKTAKVHEIIAQCLSASNSHPNNVPAGDRSVGAPVYISYAINDIALQLFGPDVLDEYGRLSLRYRPHLQAICQRSWYNLTRRLERAEDRFALLEERVKAAFDGKCVKL